MRLDGGWRAAVSTPDLERLGGDPDLDDADWCAVPVPGHWAEVPELADALGPVLYRRHFDHPRPASGRRSWLVLDGVLTQGDVWLDGTYLGDTEGYFVPHRFEVTDQLAARTDHILALGVACAAPATGRSKRSLTGSLQAGPLAPRRHPGGIWRPVHVAETGPVAIHHSRLLCSRATPERAELLVRLVVLAPGVEDAQVVTTVVDPDGVEVSRQVDTRPLATGENRLEWSVTVDRPRRWWPAALGDQPQYDVVVRIVLDGVESDVRQWRTGLRDIAFDNFTFRVNGERLFAKGIALGPQSSHLGSLDADVIARDLRAARDAGFDLIRVHGHVGRPELYQAADELGLLVWQDLPLVDGYATSTRSQARRQTREAVDLLGHHPSVALWCPHDEPNGPPVPEPAGTHASLPAMGRRLARHVLPSWNRDVLDPQLRRELRTNDRSRPVLAHSGAIPQPGRLTGTDSHLWLGWRVGRAEDLPRVLRRWPRLGRFMGAFGAQSVAPGDHPYGTLRLHGADRGSFERYLPRDAYASGQAWAAATREYQASVLRQHIETLRRLKYRPAGGFCAFALVDADPVVGYGLLDVGRRPKPAYDAVVDACRAVIVVADRPPPMVSPGDQIDLAVHAVSDRREPIEDVVVTARLSVGGEVMTTRWSGRLEADSCAFIGRLRAEVPAGHGPLFVDLDLQAEGVVASNRYRAEVIPRAEATSRFRSSTLG